MTEMTSGKIVDLLQEDHEQVKTLLAGLAAATPSARDELFCHLVTELVRHEVAEEIVVYPTIRSDTPGGDDEVAARLAEQSEAEEKLARMEKLDPDSAEFATQVVELREAVLAHAQAEEQNIFPLLRALEGEDSSFEMGARYEKAKASAPTHPHPHAPDTPPGNKLLGPVAALFDKVRDAARSI